MRLVDDAELVQSAREGDREVLAVLLDRHRATLLALCQRMVGDPFLAEDAAQEAALQALLGLDRLHQAERFGPWLCGIGLNICRRWVRDRARHSPFDELLGGRTIDVPEGAADPASLAEAHELSALVQGAVASIPAGQRSAVLLFYLSGLTGPEVAAALGVEVGSVKTRLHKARRTLRRQLQSVWTEDHAMGEQSIKMQVTEVRVTGEGAEEKYIVLLEEVEGRRRLPIWVGRAEGTAIALQLDRVETPRPLTFALTASLVRALEGTLREVRLTRLADDVFYAVATVEGPMGRRQVDARPSDALALALAMGAPVLADAAVLEQGTGSSERAAEVEAGRQLHVTISASGYAQRAEE